MPATLDLRRGQVVGDASRRYVELNAAALIAPLVKTIEEQRVGIEQLAARVAVLEGRNV
jgi:hypothetical protein